MPLDVISISIISPRGTTTSALTTLAPGSDPTFPHQIPGKPHNWAKTIEFRDVGTFHTCLRLWARLKGLSGQRQRSDLKRDRKPLADDGAHDQSNEAGVVPSPSPIRTCPLALETTDDDLQITHELTTGWCVDFCAFEHDGRLHQASMALCSRPVSPRRACFSGSPACNGHERQLANGIQAQATERMPFARPPARILISVSPTRTLVPLPVHKSGTGHLINEVHAHRPRATPPALPALEMLFATSIGVCNDVARRNGGHMVGEPAMCR
ncbi:hypothetical protein BD779DRAFT_1671564 [Infundibulicybe gibba]|nr:hypothetical protein BD779DRAFT_1671564 [Infundibulicybe gibba]